MSGGERQGLKMEMEKIGMDDAITVGNSVLLNEQAQLLRECRTALDALLEKRPLLGAVLCGSTTLGNLRAELYAYRPSGVFNGVLEREKG